MATTSKTGTTVHGRVWERRIVGGGGGWVTVRLAIK